MSTFTHQRGLESRSSGHGSQRGRVIEVGRSAWSALQRVHGNRGVERLLARKAQTAEQSHVPPPVETTIERLRGSGQALDAHVRKPLESAFGADFSGVRVHTGSDAHSLNRQVGAVAFTTGRDIFFSNGAYDPGSSRGRHLLAHELTHVVQQGHAESQLAQRSCAACEEEEMGRLQRKMYVSQPEDAQEREADAVAGEVTAILDTSPLASSAPE